jgi:crooked neck
MKRPGNSWKVRYPHSLSQCGGQRKLTVGYAFALPDYDYIFADDEREANPTSFKFLQMAHAWAAAKKAGKAGGVGPTAGSGGSGGGGGGGGALSRFAAAKDSRADSDSGANESMDEDVASVASSQDES